MDQRLFSKSHPLQVSYHVIPNVLTSEDHLFHQILRFTIGLFLVCILFVIEWRKTSWLLLNVTAAELIGFSVNSYNLHPSRFVRNGLQRRKNSWQDGVYGTTCPIPPGKNFTYVLQPKDQLGSYFYFPSLALHKAAGGFGSIKISSRPHIPVPFPPPAGDYTVFARDWFKGSLRQLKYFLDGGHNLPLPDGLIINGRGWNGYTFTVDPGKTYRFRISNVQVKTSINFRIEGHAMKLVTGRC